MKIALTTLGLVAFLMTLAFVGLPTQRGWDKFFSENVGYNLDKAIVEETYQEANSARSFDSSLKAAVAASTNFADLKVRIAAIQARSQITVTNLYIALSNDVVNFNSAQ